MAARLRCNAPRSSRLTPSSRRCRSPRRLRRRLRRAETRAAAFAAAPGMFRVRACGRGVRGFAPRLRPRTRPTSCGNASLRSPRSARHGTCTCRNALLPHQAETATRRPPLLQYAGSFRSSGAVAAQARAVQIPREPPRSVLEPSRHRRNCCRSPVAVRQTGKAPRRHWFQKHSSC